MQVNGWKEQVEKVVPAWCTEHGFGDDPVTVSTFMDLAARLLDVLPLSPSTDARLSLLEEDILLTDQQSLTDAITDDIVEDWPSSSFEASALTGSTLHTVPAAPAPAQSAAAKGSPDTSGDWRALFHDDDWWAVGHHMMYPARNEDDAWRICQELEKRGWRFGRCALAPSPR